MTDATAIPELPPVVVEELSLQECADYLTKIRAHMIEHGRESVSDGEVANVVHCMRRIRGESAKRGKSAKPAVTVSLSDF